jgi:hypothetical protein
MLRVIFVLSLYLFSGSFSYSQSAMEGDIEVAYQNAKKGIYWALSNIPEKRAKLENSLIADDKLYATVKLEKEINGVKIESVGYNHSNTVIIRIYKSNDSLVKEGYLKKETSD